MTIPFIGTNDLSDALGEDVSTSDLAIIAIDSACEMIRAELGNDINLEEDADITLSGTGTYRLILPEPPVREVSEVVIDAGLATEETLATTDYVLDDLPRLKGAFLRRISAVWPVGLRNITLTYTHGWDITEPLSDPPVGFERVPSSIRSVALGLATRIYRSHTSGATGATTSLKLGSAAESFDVASAVAATTPLLTTEDLKALHDYKTLVFV